MGVLGEGYVDYDWLGEGEQAGSQEVSELPGGFGGECWEHEGAVYAVEFVEVARGEGDFGGRHFDFGTGLGFGWIWFGWMFLEGGFGESVYISWEL